LFFLGIYIAGTVVDVGIKDHGQILKLFEVEEFIRPIGYSHFFKLNFKLIFIHVFCIVFSNIACLFLLLVGDTRILRDGRDDARLRSGDQIEIPQTQEKSGQIED
jgi:hypothetical protein